jgi:hypothetical protein
MPDGRFVAEQLQATSARLSTRPRPAAPSRPSPLPARIARANG